MSRLPMVVFPFQITAARFLQFGTALANYPGTFGVLICGGDDAIYLGPPREGAGAIRHR